PFFLADRFPPPWKESGTLAAPAWPDESAPPRTVGHVQRILQREDGPELLGGCQALLDGGRLVFERPAPESALLRDLWALLPTSPAAGRGPAGFASGNARGSHPPAVPRAGGQEFEYSPPEQGGGESRGARYDLALQFAGGAGDRAELARLSARRSRRETFR